MADAASVLSGVGDRPKGSRVETAGHLARTVPPLAPGARAERARDRFAAQVSLLVLPVVEADGRVAGVLNRFRFLERFASRFGQDLAARKPVSAYMEEPLLVEQGTPADAVGALLLTEESRYIFDGFVVVREGRYLGVATGFDVLRAFTTRRHAELEHQARHDPLTGLPNRAVFEQCLTGLPARTPDGSLSAVLFIDLDRFKEINDAYGHRFGDLVLSGIAARLRATLRRQDLVARLSGDEFAAIVEGLGSRADASRLAQLLVANCAAPLTIEDRVVSVSCSVGIALYPEHATSPESLARAADAAAYTAKEVRNHWQLYGSDVEDTRLPALVGALRHALEAGSLEVHYQPIVRIDTGVVTGVEALVRWTHPQLGAVPASQIVRLAEESGLVVVLDARFTPATSL